MYTNRKNIFNTVTQNEKKDFRKNLNELMIEFDEKFSQVKDFIIKFEKSHVNNINDLTVLINLKDQIDQYKKIFKDLTDRMQDILKRTGPLIFPNIQRNTQSMSKQMDETELIADFLDTQVHLARELEQQLTELLW